MSGLEQERQANIQRNKDHLKELGILYKPPTPLSRVAIKRPSGQKRKFETLPPARSSARIASAPTKPSYVEDQTKEVSLKKGKKQERIPATSSSKHTGPTANAIIPAKDLATLRAGWIAWEPVAPPPTRDEESVLHFVDQSTFLPNKSPEEMLREGCFGGSYFRPLYSRQLDTVVEDDYKELPRSWYEGLDVTTFLTSPQYDPEVSKYKVKCGQSIEEWEAAGWISHAHDIRGWFQWYCRFFMGRRCDDDERQISRWRKCVGETGRWRRTLLKKYISMGVHEVFDDGADDEKGDVSPVMHQTCFHWAYEYFRSAPYLAILSLTAVFRVRQGDLDRFWASAT